MRARRPLPSSGSRSASVMAGQPMPPQAPFTADDSLLFETQVLQIEAGQASAFQMGRIRQMMQQQQMMERQGAAPGAGRAPPPGAGPARSPAPPGPADAAAGDRPLTLRS